MQEGQSEEGKTWRMQRKRQRESQTQSSFPFLPRVRTRTKQTNQTAAKHDNWKGAIDERNLRGTSRRCKAAVRGTFASQYFALYCENLGGTAFCSVSSASGPGTDDINGPISRKAWPPVYWGKKRE